MWEKFTDKCNLAVFAIVVIAIVFVCRMAIYYGFQMVH